MVTIVTCWIVIHTAKGALDNRQYRPVKGTIMKDSGDKFLVNFYDSFKAENVDRMLNPVVQRINGNDCLYESEP